MIDLQAEIIERATFSARKEEEKAAEIIAVNMNVSSEVANQLVTHLVCAMYRIAVATAGKRG